MKLIVEITSPMWYNNSRCGGVAQLGECLLRMQEVESSNLFVSTKASEFVNSVNLIDSDILKCRERFIFPTLRLLFRILTNLYCYELATILN